LDNPGVLREAQMARGGRVGFVLVAGAFAVAISGTVAQAQQTQYPKPTDLPNPYRLVEGWPTLPKSMNGGRWGEVIRVHVHRDGNIWIFHRCFNTIPAGHATCIGRGDANPPSRGSGTRQERPRNRTGRKPELVQGSWLGVLGGTRAGWRSSLREVSLCLS